MANVENQLPASSTFDKKQLSAMELPAVDKAGSAIRAADESDIIPTPGLKSASVFVSEK